MATDPKDAGQSQSGKEPRDTGKSEQVVRPTTWTDRGDMVSNNTAAHQMFVRNSDRLQKATEAKRDAASQDQSALKPSAPEPDKTSSHATMKREQADATAHQSVADHERGKASEDRRLSFAKDHERGARLDLKAESAKQPGKELTFVKDQGQDINRGR